MAIAKLAISLVMTIIQQLAATPPHPRPPEGQLRNQNQSERAAIRTATFIMLSLFTTAMFEDLIFLVLSGYCPPTIARPILGVLPVSVTTTLTPTYLTGVFFTLWGSLLRTHCYRRLGPSFTFELSIRPAHTLVTDGVYGLVRHPSYTGALLLLAGWFLRLFDLRAFLHDRCTARFPIWMSANVSNCHAMVTGVLACAFVTFWGFVFVTLHKRMDNEDAMLEKNFGDEWRAWAKRVPYRLVPGVC